MTKTTIREFACGFVQRPDFPTEAWYLRNRLGEGGEGLRQFGWRDIEFEIDLALSVYTCITPEGAGSVNRPDWPLRPTCLSTQHGVWRREEPGECSHPQWIHWLSTDSA
jgi:hypothetical protein